MAQVAWREAERVLADVEDVGSVGVVCPWIACVFYRVSSRCLRLMPFCFSISFTIFFNILKFKSFTLYKIN